MTYKKVIEQEGPVDLEKVAAEFAQLQEHFQKSLVDEELEYIGAIHLSAFKIKNEPHHGKTLIGFAGKAEDLLELIVNCSKRNPVLERLILQAGIVLCEEGSLETPPTEEA